MNPEKHSETLRARLSKAARVEAHAPMAGRTTLGVGGPADVLAEPADEADLAAVLRYVGEAALPLFVLGRGSNLLVRDGGIRGVVLSVRQEFFSRIEVQAGQLHCGAGARLKHVANAARDAGIGGLEFLEGIPGSLGGALRMNAGAMGAMTFEVVDRVRFISLDGAVEERPAAAMGAGYRSCEVLREHIALGAVLRGASAAEAAVRARMEEFRLWRTSTQPHNRSAGCMFKNPEAKPAGQLVDECGLKGLRVGAAGVSDIHGNFIINHGQATAADVIELITQVRARVKEQTGIELQTEVQMVGE